MRTVKHKAIQDCCLLIRTTRLSDEPIYKQGLVLAGPQQQYVSRGCPRAKKFKLRSSHPSVVPTEPCTQVMAGCGMLFKGLRAFFQKTLPGNAHDRIPARGSARASPATPIASLHVVQSPSHPCPWHHGPRRLFQYGLSTRERRSCVAGGGFSQRALSAPAVGCREFLVAGAAGGFSSAWVAAASTPEKPVAIWPRVSPYGDICAPTGDAGPLQARSAATPVRFIH